MPLTGLTVIALLAVFLLACHGSGNYLEYAKTDCAHLTYHKETKIVYEIRVFPDRVKKDKDLWIKLGDESPVPLVELPEEMVAKMYAMLPIPDEDKEANEKHTYYSGWTKFIFIRGKLVSVVLQEDSKHARFGHSPETLKPLAMSLDDVPSIFGEIRSYGKQKVMAP